MKKSLYLPLLAVGMLASASCSSAHEDMGQYRHTDI